MSEITKEQLIEHIANMTVLELSELVKELEEKFGVSAAAAAVAAAESTHVESALTGSIFFPPKSEPESDASLKASSADAAIAGVRDSIGPVNPKIIPILIACPSAITIVPKVETNINAAINSFFIIFLFYC